MTLLQIFTLTCGVVWIVTSIIKAITKGTSFDTGAELSSDYDIAKEELPRSSLILAYFYLLWFRGPFPHAVDHNLFDYMCAVFAACIFLQFLIGIFHLVKWIRLEAKGMEYGYGSGGFNAGLFRISKRLSADEALLDPMSREKRLSAQIYWAIERRRDWQIATGTLLIASAGTFYAYTYAPWAGLAAAIAALGPALTWWLTRTGDSLAYHLGAQFIPGAKVLEPEAPRMGLHDVYNQKAHGNARLATEAETLAAATAGAQRSQVHDQEF